ncbi:alpha/beta-hydrolase [Gyrodon lividus]|nr:alpha/beta-hydrolase [Gyrodon lividus]
MGKVLEVSTDELETTRWPWPHFPRVGDPSVGVDQSTYDNLVRYTKYASGAYQMLCPRPMGNALVAQFTDLITSTQGFIARDDQREELVIAFRGSTDVTSILVGMSLQSPQVFSSIVLPWCTHADTSIVLVPLKGHGLPPLDPSKITRSAEPRVHIGFLVAYQSIARTLLVKLEHQLQAHPSYTIIVCGHSLGGAIASIASIAINHTFPGRPINVYTSGQPRTGNAAFAELVEGAIGVENVYRCVHLIDGVPTMIPTNLGYRHFATEYWEFTELGKRFPINLRMRSQVTTPLISGPPKNVKRCKGGEDPDGSASVPSTGVNPAHWVYFRQPIASDPTVCL